MTSLVVRWMRLCASSSGDMGLIPGWETESPHAEGHMPFGMAKKSFFKKKKKKPKILRIRTLTGFFSGQGKGAIQPLTIITG